MTLNTISVVVNQYNNTAITTTTTVYGDIVSVNATTVSEVKSIAELLSEGFEHGNFNYGTTSIGIGNATQGKVDGSVTIPYPTPYLAIDGFQYVSVTDRVHGCPPGHLKASNDTCTCIMDPLVGAFVLQHVGYPLQGWGPGGEVYPSQQSITVSLTSTYYEALKLETLGASDFLGPMNSETGIVNSASFFKFLSAASVFESYPDLSSCSLFSLFNGPPAVLVPAAALTTSVSTTIANTGKYNVPTAQPASPVKATTVPQTAEASSPTPTIPAAPVSGPEDPTPGTPTVSPEPPKGPEVPSSNPPGSPKNSPSPPGAQPVAGSSTVAEEQVMSVQGTFTLNQGEPNTVQSVPILTFDGSTYQANQASHFVIAGQTVTPGGRITISNTPIAIDKDASTAIIGTSTQSLSNMAATPKPHLVFAATTYTADDSDNFVINDKTLTKGGTIQVDGTRLSYDEAGKGVVIGSSTQLLALPGTTLAAKPVFTFGGSTYTADSSSEFIINGQTLTKGGTVVVQGTQISYNTGGTAVLIGTSTQNLFFASITPAPQPILTFDGSTYTANPSSNFVIDGQTLIKGGAIAIDGTRISYNEAGTAAVIGTKTQSLSFATITPAAEAILTFDGSTYSANPSSNFVIDDQTLTKGGVITINGTPLFYDQAGTDVVIGTSTQRLSLATVTRTAEAVLTFDGSTYTANPSSNFVIDGQTLTKGGEITVDGTNLFYDDSGTDIVIGTSTQILHTTNVAGAPDPTITFDGSTFYADTSSDFVIDGQTLTKGGVITVHGTPISYAADGTDVVVGTSTEAVGGLGGYIMSGFGGGGVGPSATGVQPTQFTGRAARVLGVSWSWSFVLGACIVLLGLG